MTGMYAVPFGALAVILTWRLILSAHTRPWGARDVAWTATAGGMWWVLVAVGVTAWLPLTVAAAHILVAFAVALGRVIEHGGEER